MTKEDDNVAISLRIAERIRKASAEIVQEELTTAESLPASVLINAAAATAGGILDIIERRSGGLMDKPRALGLLTILIVNGLDHSPIEVEEDKPK